MRAHPRVSFPAGARYAYSNLAYWLLGKVIERASGLPFRDYLPREIFSPLGASAGELSLLAPDTDLAARGYQRKYSAMGLFTRVAVRGEFLDGSEGGWLRFRRVYMNGPPYGGIVCTARGFSRFLRDQLRKESTLFGSEQRALFFSAQQDAHGHAVPTTLGWHRGELAGVTYFGKPGGGPGFHGNVRIYPEPRIATAWFVNHMEVSERAINEFGDAADRHWLTSASPHGRG
jgi:D-alanyl-D-alanine carboxypeptidase